MVNRTNPPLIRPGEFLEQGQLSFPPSGKKPHSVLDFRDPRVQAARATRKRKAQEELNQEVDKMLESDESEEEEKDEDAEVESVLSVTGASDEE